MAETNSQTANTTPQTISLGWARATGHGSPPNDQQQQTCSSSGSLARVNSTMLACEYTFTCADLDVVVKSLCSQATLSLNKGFLLPLLLAKETQGEGQ